MQIKVEYLAGWAYEREIMAGLHQPQRLVEPHIGQTKFFPP